MMRALVIALLGMAVVVAIEAQWSPLPTTQGPGCPEGGSPGKKFDVKPGCQQCICYKDPSKGHFCRQCRPKRTYNIPGFKPVYSNTPTYPSCCYPKFVKE